jgi:two-component system, sensor histidine kinase
MSRPRHSVLTVLTVLGLTMLLVQNAQAQPPGPVRTPLELAAAVEKRAAATDFAALDAFGRTAMNRHDREGLQRLHHVAWILLNQGEFVQARTWNDRLTQAARLQNDLRYQQVARLNALSLRYNQGETGVAEEMRQVAATEQDWFARAHATRLWALALMDRDKIGDGLKLLADADAFIPSTSAYAETAQAGLWEMTGLGLMKLNDIDGATAAFGRFEIDLANPAYPRPDFDAIYNLARLSTQLGDPEQAQRLYMAHHRLTLRAGLPSLAIYDANLCVTTAEARHAPNDVLACLAPYGQDLGAASFLAANLLPSRAIAYAQTGQLALARRDLAAIKGRIAAGQYRDKNSYKLGRIEAEILFADGKSREAYETLRDYAALDKINDARRYSAGIRQVTGDMQQQLAERRAQLETARVNTTLQRDVIKAQNGGMVIAVIFVLSALAAMFWLWRQAGHLRVARRRAEDASRSKSEFLANMSHEIRTPLNGVVAMADALSRTALPPPEQEMVNVIRTSGVTLERLLSDILDSAKIEAGQIAIEHAAFELGDTVRGAVALYRPKADAKGLILQTQIDPALEGLVEGDVVRLRQVLSNLISNALKFTTEGSVSIAVDAAGPDRVRFTVTDTGCGFDADLKDRIFTRFQQADGSITRRFGGTGLGLAISRHLVELMGGTMDCDGVPGEGARFWFELPLPAGAAPIPTHAEARQDLGETAFPARILLADDHPANRKVVEIMLAHLPTELVTVDDGDAAVAAFRDGGFELVLMDMQMPVMDGLSATTAIRALEQDQGRPRTPIIMLTANALPEHMTASAAAGADSHLTKPITLHSLLDGIATAVEAAEHHRQTQTA